MDIQAQAPPASNRGVLNTSQHVLRACVDWVQVTFKTVQSVQQVYEILGIPESEFISVPSGMYGYRTHKQSGHISVLSDGAPDMGVHIQMTGQGCREYETLRAKNWNTFFVECFANNGNFTRIDGAIDDIAYNDAKPYFTVNKLYRKVREGCVQSKFKRGKRVESFSVNDGMALGETLYFGREQSDIQIRFYEKDFERLEAGKDLEEDLTAWNRTEIQCRRDRAQAMALYLVNGDDFGEILAGVLKNYVNFLVKNPTESNKSRWRVCEWWEKFLGDVEPLPLTFIAPDKTIEKSHSWITKQVSPTLGMLFYAHDGDLDIIREFLEDGMDRLTEEQIALADDYKEKLKFAKQYDQGKREDQRRQNYQLMMARSINTHRKSPLDNE